MSTENINDLGDNSLAAGRKRSASEAGLSHDMNVTGPVPSSSGPAFSDYYLQSQRGEDLHLSESGRAGGVTEESFCSNFVCCGVHLADLHALLQHYEDVHVKVQNGDDEERQLGGFDDDEEEEERGDEEENNEVDVVGDGSNGSSRMGASQRSRDNKRTDSVLSTHSFGSTAAADALLGVATTYAPSYNSSARPGGYDPPSMPLPPPPGGYYYAPPPPHYYAPPPPPPQAMRGEQPVAAFDTTILRTVSPAMAATGGYGPPPGYPGYYPFYSPYYAHPPHMYPPPGAGQPMMHQQQPHMMYPSPYMPHPQQPIAPLEIRPGKRARPGPQAPNLRAVQAASSTLRDTLPAALGSQHDPNQFKLIYSILSNTLTPAPQPSDAAAASNVKEQEALDRAAQAKNTAAAILAMPRAPVDKSLERPYLCPVPGCGKAYKNPNGLKYHALHGHDGTQELVERPYKCPYGDCGKRYKNPNGLKYHVNKNHVDMLPKSALVARNAQKRAKSGMTEDDVEDSDSDAHDHSETEA